MQSRYQNCLSPMFCLILMTGDNAGLLKLVEFWNNEDFAFGHVLGVHFQPPSRLV